MQTQQLKNVHLSNHWQMIVFVLASRYLLHVYPVFVKVAVIMVSVRAGKGGPSFPKY